VTPFYCEDGITIYHADYIDVVADLMRVDHVITDPPYSAHTHAKQWIAAALTADGGPRMATAHTELGFPPFTDLMRDRFCSIAHAMVHRWTLVFSDLESITPWQTAFTAHAMDYVRACIWDKVDGAPQFTGDRPAAGAEAIVCAHRKGPKQWNGGGRRGVFRHAVNGERGAKPHPSTKPETLMVELIGLFTDPGDLILDPFMGSGTTLVAAKRMGRKAIGIDYTERWCDVAASRLSQGALALDFSNGT